MHNLESVLENETHKILWEFWDTNGSSNLGQTTRPGDNHQKKKRSFRRVNFAESAYHRVKLKVGEMKDKYLDLARKY